MVAERAEQGAAVIGNLDLAAVDAELHGLVDDTTPGSERDQGTFRFVANNSDAISQMTRRRFLGLSAGTAALAACGGGSPEQESAATKWFADQTIVADGTPQRTIWSLADSDGNLGDLAPDTFDYTVLDPDSAEIASGVAHKHADGVLQPYYPIAVAFERSGVHEFLFATADHGRHVGFASPGLPEDTTLFWPGDRFPSVVTPTLDNDAGVAQICTRSELCPFHEISLDVALASDRRTVMIVTTPAFCGTVIMCGPVLEILIDEIGTGGYDVDVLHAEVYIDPQPDAPGDLAPVVVASGVTYEPYIFLFDRDGTVIARLDHIWDRAELRELLSLS